MKSVQIPESLFQELLNFFCDLEFRSILLDLYTPDYLIQYDDIGRELRKKYSQIVKRERFSRYKTSVGADREAARREYLDAAEISEDYRTRFEIDSENL